jgi:hypothetical protein
MRILLTVAALNLLVSPSIAQHPPAPQNAPFVVSKIGEEVGHILFDVVERKAIEEFYGHLSKRDLSTDLNNNLPPGHQETERAKAGNDVVLVHQATGVVLDILQDIVTK